MSFTNKEGKLIVLNIIDTIQKHKDYLSEIDGAIGDGDHGAPLPHQYTHKVHAGLSRWLLPARLSLWRGRTPMSPLHVICFSLSLSS